MTKTIQDLLTHLRQIKQDQERLLREVRGMRMTYVDLTTGELRELTKLEDLLIRMVSQLNKDIETWNSTKSN